MHVWRTQCVEIQRSRRRRASLRDMASTVLRDLRLAVRTLRRRPGFAGLASGTLALGLAATATGFALVDASLLRGLPYPDANRLMLVWETDPAQPQRDVAPANFLDLAQRTRGVDGWAAFRGMERTLTGTGAASRILTASVTRDFFGLLGSAPELGTGFDGRRLDADGPAAVLGFSLWRGDFGSDPDVVGRTVDLGGQAYTVVGVAPSGFDFPEGTEAWTWSPVDLPELPGFPDDLRQLRDARFIRVLALRTSGTPIETVRADLDRVMADLRVEHPEANRNAGATAIPLRDHLVASFRPTVTLLFGAVLLLLLIALVNVGNLLLVRVVERTHELSIRSALGASHRRLSQHQFAESAVVGVVGGGVGLALAAAAIGVASRLAAGSAGSALRFDVRVVGFLILVTLVVTVLFGALPAALPRLRSAASLTGRGTASASSALVLRRGLMVAEVALAFALVLGAGLAIRTALNLQRVDVGFDSGEMLTLRVSPGQSTGEPAETARALSAIHDALAAHPAVVRSGVASSGPVAVGPSAGLRVEGVPFPAGEAPDVGWQFVSPDYFDAFAIPMVRGRTFDGRDGVDGVPVAIVNQTLARQVFGDESPLGRRINTGLDGEGVWAEIVGVATDTRNRGPARPVFPTMYRPLAQAAGGSAMVGVRLDRAPGPALIGELTRSVHAVDPDAPVYRVQTGEELLASYTGPTRTVVRLLGVFALLALALASVGIYGVTAYAVANRRRELGVRVALGAPRSEILGRVIWDTLRPCFVGLAVGCGVAMGAAALFRGLLFGVSPVDPVNALVVALLLTSICTGASLGPAFRAARLDPVVSLRAD